MFAYGAEWTTRYLNEEGKLMQYSIVINIQDLSTYTDSDEIELDKSIYSTGTDVKFLNIHNLAFEHITSPSFCDYIAQQFAWFLCLNETKGYNVKLNGIKGGNYTFEITDDQNKTILFEYYFDKKKNEVILVQKK